MATLLHPRTLGMPKHGTTSRYRRGCRCDGCSRAGSLATKRNKMWRYRTGQSRLRPALASRRRLLSLGYLGYTQRELANIIGTTQRTISRIVTGEYPRVYIGTDRRIAEVFDRLSANPRPAGSLNAQRRAHLHAVRQGAVPPLAWNDDTIRNPAASPGDPARTRSTYHERALYAIDAYRQGRDIDRIAATLGTTPEALVRQLERHGRPRLAAALHATRIVLPNQDGRKKTA